MRSVLRSCLALSSILFPAGCALHPLDPEPAPEPSRSDLFSAVDPRIGTGGIGFATGSTYPGPALPFAMIHPGPDTTTANGGLPQLHCSGYYAQDDRIRGFSLTRMNGTGVPDYGTLAFMPVDGMSPSHATEAGYTAAYSHDDETAHPGYYAVRLSSGIRVEITSSLRAALFRFDFPDGTDPVVIADPMHKISGTTHDGRVDVDLASSHLAASVHLDGDMSGRFGGFDLHSDAHFEPAPFEAGVWDATGLHAGTGAANGDSVGAWVRFPAGTRSVTLRVGVSFVDDAGAAANLDAEVPSFDFDSVRSAAEQAWTDVTSAVEVYGAPPEDTTLLATALYHAHLMPTLMSDTDGRRVNFHGEPVQGNDVRYSDFSLWDTYRTVHPWLLLAERKENEAFAASLIGMAEECGAVPRWPLAQGDTGSMVGSPGEIVLAESAAKGVAMDEQKAYELSRAAAFGPVSGGCGGRTAIGDYLTLGYVPSDDTDGSVSHTQEYAVADAALATWARRLGRTADAEALEKRGGSWASLYDSQVGFFRGKHADGTWDTFPGPVAGGGPYTEGDAWQYLWMVPHDPQGLAATLGGREKALERLREYFEKSAEEKPVVGHRNYHWQGNEPDIHAPWLFAAWQSPAEAVRWVDWVWATMYGTGPDGLPGNDDGGTMSAWLLFAAAGIYPVNGTDQLIVGAPRYARMIVHRPSGDLRIEASPDPRTNRTPLSVALDGVALTSPYLTHAQLQGAHRFSFVMGASQGQP